jgi:hypothetical protein
MLAAASGRLAEAERGFEAALALEQSVHAAPLAARTRVSHARALLSLGDQKDGRRAAQQLDAAAHTADGLGMRGLMRDIQALRGAEPARG